MVWSARLCLSSVFWVTAYVFNVVIYLTKLLFNFLGLLTIYDFYHPIIFLMWSDLSSSLLIVFDLIWSTTFSLDTWAHIARICIDKNIWHSSRFIKCFSFPKAILIRVLLSMVFAFEITFIFDLFTELHKCFINTVSANILCKFTDRAINLVETPKLAHPCQRLNLEILLATLSKQFFLFLSL